MKVRRKSLWRSKNAARHFRKRANQRAAKERKRLEQAARDESMPDTSHVIMPRLKPSGFRITVECTGRCHWRLVSGTARPLPQGSPALRPDPRLQTMLRNRSRARQDATERDAARRIPMRLRLLRPKHERNDRTHRTISAPPSFR